MRGETVGRPRRLRRWRPGGWWLLCLTVRVARCGLLVLRLDWRGLILGRLILRGRILRQRILRDTGSRRGIGGAAPASIGRRGRLRIHRGLLRQNYAGSSQENYYRAKKRNSSHSCLPFARSYSTDAYPYCMRFANSVNN